MTSVWERLLVTRTAEQARGGRLDPADPLVDRYLPLCLAGPRHVVGQLGQSLDGCIASRTGDAVFVTGAEDRTHLHRVRALCDAVLVGVGTVLADDPRLTVRHVTGGHPVRVVLDPRGRAPHSLGVFTDAAAPTVWLVGRDVAVSVPPAGVSVQRVELTGQGVSTAAVVEALAALGLGRLLVEGGGYTVSRFLAEGTLDVLYVTVAPLLVGDGRRGLAFPGHDRLAEALRPSARTFRLGEDTLYELDLRGSPTRSACPTSSRSEPAAAL